MTSPVTWVLLLAEEPEVSKSINWTVLDLTDLELIASWVAVGAQMGVPLVGCAPLCAHPITFALQTSLLAPFHALTGRLVPPEP